MREDDLVAGPGHPRHREIPPVAANVEYRAGQHGTGRVDYVQDEVLVGTACANSVAVGEAPPSIGSDAD